MIVIILACVGMVVQDILEVLKVDSQARNRGFLAGIFDALMYFALLASVIVGNATITGHNLFDKVFFLGLITIANIVGQMAGVAIGKRYIKEVV